MKYVGSLHKVLEYFSLLPIFSYRFLLLTLEICYNLYYLSESMTVFLNCLLKVKVTETRNWLKICNFLIFKEICPQFVVILSLYLVVINIFKCYLNTNTFLLLTASKVMVKVI